MHEDLKHGQRAILAHIDDGISLRVPAAADSPRSLAVICWVGPAQPEGQHQPRTPHSIRVSTSSASWKPSSVAAASRGVRPPRDGFGVCNHPNAFSWFANASPACTESAINRGGNCSKLVFAGVVATGLRPRYQYTPWHLYRTSKDLSCQARWGVSRDQDRQRGRQRDSAVVREQVAMQRVSAGS